MTKKVLAIIIGMSIIFTAGSALAADTSGTANYSVTLTDGCTIDTTATSTDFGTHFIGTPDLTTVGAGSVAITCNNGLNYAWGINQGLNANGNWLQMDDGSGNNIRYQLFEGGTQLGDGGMGTVSGGSYSEVYAAYTDRDATGTGAAQTYNLQANVRITDGGVAGTYTDTVTVSVVWP